MATTYPGSGDASRYRQDYRPRWLDNLAGDVTMEGSVMTGIAEGPEAIQAILGFARCCSGPSSWASTSPALVTRSTSSAGRGGGADDWGTVSRSRTHEAGTETSWPPQ